MLELFMYVYSCNALSAQFFAVDRALNSYFIIIMIRTHSSIQVTPLRCFCAELESAAPTAA